jgi:hypothetical protein
MTKQSFRLYVYSRSKISTDIIVEDLKKKFKGKVKQIIRKDNVLTLIQINESKLKRLIQEYFNSHGSSNVEVLMEKMRLEPYKEKCR